MNKDVYLDLIKQAFLEDLGDDGDVTSESIFKDACSSVFLFSKDNGVLAGIQVFKDAFLEYDQTIKIEEYFKDGDILKPGDKIAAITGRVVSLLSAERVALNFLSLLSGIATRTSAFARAASESGKAVILDTRKTIPGFRKLSKYAVKTGGGTNHRMGLYDMVMIKDNHIDAAGSITGAVTLVREKWGDRFRIEVECRTLEDVEEAAALGVEVVMLDNMTKETMEQAVKLAAGRVKLEASGNMDLEKVKQLSSIGIDYISIGMLTKSVEAFDFSMRMG